MNKEQGIWDNVFIPPQHSVFPVQDSFTTSLSRSDILLFE